MILPRMTIVTCSFNQARFLEKTILSVLNQNYPELEHIIIDGGSTDNSVDIIKKYADRLAYWVSEKDRGQTHALIKGLSRATGEIQGWLCSDDLLEPGALQEVAKFFATHPKARWVYGDACWIDAEDRFIKWKREIPFCPFIWLYDHNYIPQPATFWRRDLYEEVGGLDESFKLAMDTDLFWRFSRVAHPCHVRKLWARMRSYPEQRNKTLRAESDAEDMRIRAKYLGRTPTAFELASKFVIAKSLRIAYKLFTGCYFAPRPPEPEIKVGTARTGSNK
jgi:glycosyltransferase involved in cell wall biosynthesis